MYEEYRGEFVTIRSETNMTTANGRKKTQAHLVRMSVKNTHFTDVDAIM